MTLELSVPPIVPVLTKDNQLAIRVLEEVIRLGCTEFCLCPGKRNAPLVYPLTKASQVQIYYWPEERSAAFFALGRIKATGRPAAIVTTSGTAAGELLPAVMEAHYSSLPLILITADRLRRDRGTGAPQCVEQVDLYGSYAHEMLDLEGEEECNLEGWTGRGPLHLNVCFDEPSDSLCRNISLDPVLIPQEFRSSPIEFAPVEGYCHFLSQVRHPLVIVGALQPENMESAVNFLLHFQAPVYAESLSGIREDPRLAHLRITRIERLWSLAAQEGYPIDGVLRLGGVPTARLWRDLEEKAGAMRVYSISEQPFSGLSSGGFNHTSLNTFFDWARTLPVHQFHPFSCWQAADQKAYQALLELFQEEPYAEPSLIHTLSKRLTNKSKVYLGNSLPIREWDQAATYISKHYQMGASRGANGIDGQLSAFLGFATSQQDNWAIIGDLTALYDMVAPWIGEQMPGISANVVVVNNGGGRIFARMFHHPAFQHMHRLSFGHLAQFWGWQYQQWETIPDTIERSQGMRLIELNPDNEATDRFWEKLKEI